MPAIRPTYEPTKLTSEKQVLVLPSILYLSCIDNFYVKGMILSIPILANTASLNVNIVTFMFHGNIHIYVSNNDYNMFYMYA